MVPKKTDWDFSKINSIDEFMTKFWSYKNGNDLIRSLNKYARKKKMMGYGDSVRREKYSPAIYGIVLNRRKFLKLREDYRLVKVGFTHTYIAHGTGNRMEILIKEIKRKCETRAKPEILFVSPIGCVDTKPFYDTEKKIREKVGTPVKKKKITKIDLPVPTEWVLTTKKHIDKITKEIEKIKRENEKKESKKGYYPKDLIEAFKEIKDRDIPHITDVDKILNSMIERKNQLKESK